MRLDTPSLIDELVADLHKLRDEYRWLDNIGHGHRADRNPEEGGKPAKTNHSDPTGDIVVDLEAVRKATRDFDRLFRDAMKAFDKALEPAIGAIRRGWYATDGVYERPDNKIRERQISKAEKEAAAKAKRKRQQRGEDYGAA